jgi:hypothetical protein
MSCRDPPKDEAAVGVMRQVVSHSTAKGEGLQISNGRGDCGRGLDVKVIMSEEVPNNHVTHVPSKSSPHAPGSTINAGDSLIICAVRLTDAGNRTHPESTKIVHDQMSLGPDSQSAGGSWDSSSPGHG